jgi:hypothetical protein
VAHPTDLAVNDRITTVIGDFTVVQVYPRLSADDPIEVDVTPGPGVEVWDMTTLALVLGAESAASMSGARHRRFRVYFAAHRNVAVADRGRRPIEAVRLVASPELALPAPMWVG